jgi:hypothetical protein
MYSVEAFTWRHSFIIIGGLMIICVIVISYPLKPNPESLNLNLYEEKKINFYTTKIYSDDTNDEIDVEVEGLMSKENIENINLELDYDENKIHIIDNSVNLDKTDENFYEKEEKYDMNNKINHLSTYEAFKYLVLSWRVWIMLTYNILLTSLFTFNEDYVN